MYAAVISCHASALHFFLAVTFLSDSEQVRARVTTCFCFAGHAFLACLVRLARVTNMSQASLWSDVNKLAGRSTLLPALV
jgi:hypothetical protein